MSGENSFTADNQTGKSAQIQLIVGDDLPPSAVIAKVLKDLESKNLQFTTNDIYEPDNLYKSYNVIKVEVTGDSYYVVKSMEEILPIVKKIFQSYLESGESLKNKVFELLMCQLLIKEFLFFKNVKKSMVFDSSTHYVVAFTTNNTATQELPFRNLNIGSDAQNDINKHHEIRKAYLEILLEYTDLQIARLKVQESQDVLTPTDSDRTKEMQLLEVWLLLEDAGFQEGLNKNENASRRRRFYELFGLVDRNFKDRHSNWKKNPHKAEFLKERIARLKQYGNEKNATSPNK